MDANGFIDFKNNVINADAGIVVTGAQLTEFVDFLISDRGGDAWDTIPKIAEAMKARSEELSAEGCYRRAGILITMADIVESFHNRVAISYIGSSLARAFLSVSADKSADALAAGMRKGVRDFEQEAGFDSPVLEEAKQLAGSFLCALAVWNVECDAEQRQGQYSPALDVAVEHLGWRTKWPRLSRFFEAVTSKMIPTSDLLPPEQMELAL